MPKEQGENGGAQAARQLLQVGQRAGIGVVGDVLAARGAWSASGIRPVGVV